MTSSEKNQPSRPSPDAFTVLLDTNMLIAAADGAAIYDQLHDDYPHLHPAIVDGSLLELEKLQNRSKGREKEKLILAQQLAKRQDLNIVSQSIDLVDDALVSLAKASGAIIATLDKDLQRKAREQGIRVFTLQGRRRLVPAWDGQRL